LACEFNCFGIVNAIAPTNPTPSVNDICTCIANFYYNPYIPQCVINCSLFNGSMGINVDTMNCQCKPKFVWTISPTFSCKLDCTQVANSNNALSTDNINCICNPSFKYYVNTTECRRDCTVDPLSTGALVSASRCQCKTGATWNALQNKCLVSCPSIINTDGTPAVGNVCVCVTKFSWDPSTLTCVYNC
jgi:hypothetical protein